MRRIESKITILMKKILPCNSNVAMISVIVSFLFSTLCSFMFYILFKGGTQSYHDIVAGNITFPGMYKSIDFYAYYTFIIVYLISFFTISYILNRRVMIADKDNEAKQFKYSFLCFVPTLLILLIKMNMVPIFNLCFCLFILFIIFILKKAEMKSENIIKLATACFYVYLSSSGVLALAAYFYPNIADIGTRYFIPLLWVLLCVAGYLIHLFSKGKFNKLEDLLVDIISALSQLIIPLCLFSLINTRYYYQGTQYIPVYYSRFKKLVIAAILLLCFINLFTAIQAFLKRKRIQGVSLSTIISFTAVCFWNTGYNLLINTDQFHTGETAIVYQQIVEKGQKWGSEFVSVLQGLGFFVSWLNKVIFGGTYSTYIQTQNLLLVIVAALVAVLLYNIIEHKYLILLFVPVMPLFYMNRIFLIAPVLLLLLNPKIIKNPMRWTYCYALTCIIHVWYQPTYGGAVAASLIPVFVIIWYKAFKNIAIFDLRNKVFLSKFILFSLSIILIGVCCIPLLSNALHFLRTNGFETMITNGVSVYQTIHYDPAYLTGYTFLDRIIEILFKYGSGLASLIIMLYMFVRYVMREKDTVKQIQGIMLTVSAMIAYLMMLPSILTRIDPGISRIGGTGFTFFGFLVLVLLYLYRKEIEVKSVAFIVCGLSLCVGFYVTYPPYFQIHQKANSIVAIPDDAIYAKPEDTSLEKLGYAFVQNEQYLHEAMVINEMCHYLLSDHQTYYDFTDKSIYYLLTNRKVPGLYVSSMVAANELLQRESIERLKENDVPIVYINNPLRYIGVSESLRSYRIYRYFLEQDYKFVRYKGCNFLVRNDIDISPLEGNIELVDMKNMTGLNDNLIDVASYQASLSEELTPVNISTANSINMDYGNMIISGVDPYLVFNSVKQMDFNNLQMVEINLKNKPLAAMSGQLFVQTVKVNHNESNSIHFEIKTNRVLIPLYNYEQFSLDSKLISLRLDFDNVSDGTDVTVENIKLYNLNNEQKANLTQQFNNLASKTSDNRLDEIFHQTDLANLPREWGANFELIMDRFTSSQTVLTEKNNVPVTNQAAVLNVTLKQALPGSKCEFLRLKLNYGDSKHRNATVIIKGIDKYGNDFNEKFQFIANSGNVLLPIASSPNCLQAKELNAFDVIFEKEIESYQVTLEEVELYQLIQ